MTGVLPGPSRTEEHSESSTELCQAKLLDFEARQKLREEELEVLRQAIFISQNGASPYEEETFRAGFLVEPRLLQTLQERLVSFLALDADRVLSPLLWKLAHRAASDPSVKVKRAGVRTSCERTVAHERRSLKSCRSGMRTLTICRRTSRT